MFNPAGWIYWYIQRKRRKSNIRQEGFSQYGQDITVFELLGKPEQGVFIDIGANDGATFSNSLLFEKKGWTGVCVEPNPSIFRILEQNQHCHLVNACIADQDGPVDFMAVEGAGNMFSGILQFCDPHHLAMVDKTIAEQGGSRRIEQIEALSPASLCARFDIREIDFLSVDTEGCELPILKSFDFETVPARIISVENGSRSSSVSRYLTSKGYSLIKCVGCDEIYRHPSVTI